MSELKRTFTGGKMNKDLDERFVPKNQYRHATNIQVRQTLLLQVRKLTMITRQLLLRILI